MKLTEQEKIKVKNYAKSLVEKKVLKENSYNNKLLGSINPNKLEQIYTIYENIVGNLLSDGYKPHEIKTTLLKDLDDQIASML